MRKLVILYNAVFLLLGNVLISEIHHLISHDHHGNHEHAELDCYECVIIDNNNNFILDFNQTDLLENRVELHTEACFRIIEFDSADLYSPRAPPIS